METDLETVAKKVDTLESEVSELEKLHTPQAIKPDFERIREAVKKYLKSSIELKNLWRGSDFSLIEPTILLAEIGNAIGRNIGIISGANRVIEVENIVSLP